MIDWQVFTPYSALAGGGLIGLAAVILLLGAGRIAGVSGIVGALLQSAHYRDGWRWFFVLGLCVSPWLWLCFGQPLQVSITANPWLLASAGLMVGIGTRYAAGCTSGHGVCGLSRLSPRSLVATLCFMSTGVVMVTVVRHMLHLVI